MKFFALLLVGLLWSATSWATCSVGGSDGTQVLMHGSHNGLSSATNVWTVDGSTDQTANFNDYLTNCAGYGPAQLDCSSNNPYYINGAVAGGRFNLIGCGRGNGGLKFGSSGSWEMQYASGFGGYSTVKDMFIQGNSAATAFTEDSGSDYNVFLNIYCTGVKTCIKDHGSYNVIDHMWANNFLDAIIWSDGIGPIWHDLALQGNLGGSLGTSTNACIYYAGASLVMDTFDINACAGAMIIDAGTTSTGPACQNSSGNWNHISNGFFDADYAYPDGTSASLEIKNLSTGNCQMGSTHFTNVGFESSLYGLYVHNDSNWSSTINSVTCTNCQFHNNKNQGILVTGKGIMQVRFVDSNVTSNGAKATVPGTALSPNAEFDCDACAIFLTGSSFGGDGGTPGSDPWGESSEGPNETAKSTYNVLFNSPGNSGINSKIFISNTYFDGSRSTTNVSTGTHNSICYNPYYNMGTLTCEGN